MPLPDFSPTESLRWDMFLSCQVIRVVCYCSKTYSYKVPERETSYGSGSKRLSPKSSPGTGVRHWLFEDRCTTHLTTVCLQQRVKWKESVSHSVTPDSLRPQGLWPSRLLCPWDSPGKNTGVGGHSLLQDIFLTQGLNPVSCISDGFFTT